MLVSILRLKITGFKLFKVYILLTVCRIFDKKHLIKKWKY